MNFIGRGENRGYCAEQLLPLAERGDSSLPQNHSQVLVSASATDSQRHFGSRRQFNEQLMEVRAVLHRFGIDAQDYIVLL